MAKNQKLRKTNNVKVYLRYRDKVAQLKKKGAMMNFKTSKKRVKN